MSNENLDPYQRIFKKTMNMDNYIVYSVIRGAMEDIGVQIDDADEKKGYVKGFYLGNKKDPFKATFQLEKNDSYRIKIEHKFDVSLKNFQRRDLRDLSIDKFQELLIVKFWDDIYREFGLGIAPGFGEKTMAKLDEPKHTKLSNYFHDRILKLIKSDSQLTKNIKGLNDNQEEIERKYKWELKTIEGKSRWPKKMIFGMEIFFDDSHSKDRTVVLTANTLDMKTFNQLPVEINFFITMPRALSKELDMSYKCQWTVSDGQLDEDSQKILYNLNYENTTMEQRLKQLFSNESIYHFEYEELINDKGKTTKVKHDQMMLDPINVLMIKNPTTDEIRFLFVMKYFLKITKGGEYEGFLPIFESFQIMSDLFKVFKPFFIKTQEDMEKERAVQEKKNKELQESKAAVRRCVKCGWLLSATAEVCPMCGATIRKEQVTTFGVDSTEYDKSSALLDAKEKAYSEKLLSSFDKMLDSWGDAKSKIFNAVKESFRLQLQHPEIDKNIIQIIEDEEEMQQIIGPLYKANERIFGGDNEVVGRFLIQLRGYEIDNVYAVFNFIKTGKDDVYPIMITYMILSPYQSKKFYLRKQDKKKKNEEYDLIWEVDSGKDPEIIIALNKTSEEMVKIIKQIYNNPSTIQFNEPLFDEKGKIRGSKLTLDLYPIIRVEPFLDDASRPRTLVLMRQYLDYKQSGYIPLSTVFAFLDGLHGIVSLFKEDFKPAEDKSNAENFNIIDERIRTSKYTYKLQHDKEITAKTPEQIQMPTDAKKVIPPLSTTKTSPITNLLGGNKESKKEKDEMDSLLSSYSKDVKVSNEDFRNKTKFIAEIPSDFVVDPTLPDLELNNRIHALNQEIVSLTTLAELEIKSFQEYKTGFDFCKSQIDAFLKQIKDKQAMIRAYEYEKFRVKPERLTMKN